VELKHKYKYRLILDESQSFGMIGDHGKGITEYYGVPVSRSTQHETCTGLTPRLERLISLSDPCLQVLLPVVDS